MKQTPLRITIPKPCGEDFEAMPLTGPNERHCGICQRHLTDFTTMTDREVHDFVRNNSGKICGRFRADQLGRPLHAAPPQSPRWRAWLAAASLLTSGSIAAQISPPPPPISAPVQLPGAAIEPLRPLPRLQGLVTDDDGQPIPFATIQYRSPRFGFRGTMTDTTGRFELPYWEDATVTITHINYQSFELPVSSTAGKQDRDISLDVVLQAAGHHLEEIVVTSYSSGYLGEAVGITYTTTIYGEAPEETPPLPYLQEARLYPIPMRDHFNVSLVPEADHHLIATLFAPDGRQVYEWAERPLRPGPAELRYWMPKGRRLPPGQYYLRLQDEEGRTEVRVVIVQ